MLRSHLLAPVILLPLAATAVASSTTACAVDGCQEVRGSYRLVAVLSSGAGCRERFESITQIDSSTNDSGCTVRTKKTEESSSCKLEMQITCADFTGVDVMRCEDDGEKCGGVVELNIPDGPTCIYDYSATRM